MKKRTRWVLFLSGIVLVLLAASFLMNDSSVPVESVRVGRSNLQVTVVDEGRTRVRERYTITSPVTGRLPRISLNAGDRVNSGDLVTRVFPLPGSERDIEIARARVNLAEARKREVAIRLDDSRSRLNQLQRDLQRANTLASDSILSVQELERSQLAVESAEKEANSIEAALEAADADVVSARAALIGTGSTAPDDMGVPIYAPSSGRILRILDKSARVVQAGTPLLEIGDSNGLEVVIDVLSEQAVRVSPGNAVLFKKWGGDSTLTGIVHRVEPDAFTEISALGVTEQRVNIIADILNPPPSLGSGYRVEAHIIIWEGEDILTVPTSAIFQVDGDWHVFTIESGKANLRRIRIGQRSSDAAEIFEGLSVDDEVILFPSDKIDAGIKVKSEN